MANANETYAYNFYRARNYSDVAARGIVGNLSHESDGLNVNAINRGDGKDGSDSIGVAQWNSTRAARLKVYAASKNMAWNSLDAQLGFVDYELQTTERSTLRKLNAAGTDAEAVQAFLGFERPKGYSASNPAVSLGYADRLKRAVGLGGSSAGYTGGIDAFIAANPGTTYKKRADGSYDITGPDGATTNYAASAFDGKSVETGSGGGSGSGGSAAMPTVNPSDNVPEAIDQQTAIGSQTDQAIANAELQQSQGLWEYGLSFASDLFGRGTIILLGLLVLAGGVFWFAKKTKSDVVKTVKRAPASIRKNVF